MPKIVFCSVVKLTDDGLVLTHDGEGRFLPREEMDTALKERLGNTQTMGALQGMKIAAIGSDGETQALSLKRRSLLPQDALLVIDKLVPGQPCEVTLHDTNTPTYAYADMGPNIEVRVRKADFFAWIKKYRIAPRVPPDESNVRAPSEVPLSDTPYWEKYYPQHALTVGDTVCGIVESVVFDSTGRRIVVDVDVATLLIKVQDSPGEALPRLGFAGAAAPELHAEESPVSLAPAGTIRSGRAENCYRILLVDDEQDTLDAQAQWLRSKGIEATCCSSQEDVELVLREDAKNFDTALIDVCLEFGPKPFPGIQYAKQLQDLNPRCAIVLATAQPETSMAQAAEGLRIADFIERPQHAEDEIRIVRRASSKNPVPAVSLILGHLGKKESDSKAATPNAPSSNVQPRAHLEALQSAIGAETVVLFQYDGVTKLTEVVELVGALFPNYPRLRKQLRYSPVRDVCEDGVHLYDEQVLESEHLQAKHRHLLALCKDSSPYDCAVASKVTEKPGRDLHYGVFAFRCRGQAPNPSFVAELPYPAEATAADRARRWRIAAHVAQCAERLRHALHEEWALERENQLNAAFLEGMAAMGMRHDLMHALEGADKDVDWLHSVLGAGKEEHGTLLRTTERLGRFMHSALTIAHNYSAQIRAEGEGCSAFRVIDVMHDVRRGIDMYARDHGVLVTVEEESSKGIVLSTHRSALYRTLFNLVVNGVEQIALIARRNGRVCLCAHRFRKDDLKRSERKKRGVYVRVYDTGPGMHAYQRACAFEPGYSTRPDGCGLGLTICERQTKKIEGGVVRCVASPLLMGSVFEVYIPERHIHE